MPHDEHAFMSSGLHKFRVCLKSRLTQMMISRSVRTPPKTITRVAMGRGPRFRTSMQCRGHEDEFVRTPLLANLVLHLQGGYDAEARAMAARSGPRGRKVLLPHQRHPSSPTRERPPTLNNRLNSRSAPFGGRRLADRGNPLEIDGACIQGKISDREKYSIQVTLGKTKVRTRQRQLVQVWLWSGPDALTSCHRPGQQRGVEDQIRERAGKGLCLPGSVAWSPLFSSTSLLGSTLHGQGSPVAQARCAWAVVSRERSCCCRRLLAFSVSLIPTYYCACSP